MHHGLMLYDTAINPLGVPEFMADSRAIDIFAPFDPLAMIDRPTPARSEPQVPRSSLDRTDGQPLQAIAGREVVYRDSAKPGGVFLERSPNPTCVRSPQTAPRLAC